MTGKSSLSSIIYFLVVFSAVNGQESCQTPNDKPGTCKVINECKELFYLLGKPSKTQDEIKFLRSSQCGQLEAVPKVCCENKCITPEKDQGECISILKCKPLADLAKKPKPLSPTIVSYLRSTKCEGKAQFSVCCSGKEPNVTEPPKTLSESDIKALLPDECGNHPGSDVDRIFGGNETGIHLYPWLAAVQYKKKDGMITKGCGASLINKRFLITAAHCIKGPVLTRVGTPDSVRLGDYDLAHDGPDCEFNEDGDQECTGEPVVMPIEKYIPHPDYDPKKSQRNDIAVLKLSEDVTFTEFIKPICLPVDDRRPKQNKKGIFRYKVAGWGLTENGRPSDKKLHVWVPLVEPDACQAVYDKFKMQDKLWDKQMCAGGEKGKDSCNGDSGGPLMFEDKDESYILAGVVSFGPSRCGMNDVPGVYSKVLSYRDWILQQLATQ